MLHYYYLIVRDANLCTVSRHRPISFDANATSMVSLMMNRPSSSLHTLEHIALHSRVDILCRVVALGIGQRDTNPATSAQPHSRAECHPPHVTATKADQFGELLCAWSMAQAREMEF